MSLVRAQKSDRSGAVDALHLIHLTSFHTLMINSRAFYIAATIGTILQALMVLVGHSNATVAGLFAVGGMGISLLGGLTYAALSSDKSAKALAAGGATAGGVCALVGILLSFALGDVPALILVMGTLSSAVTGAIGGRA